MKKSLILLLALVAGTTTLLAQCRIFSNMEYNVALSGQASSGDNGPFWFGAGRYGAGSTESYAGALRASLIRPVEADSLRRWRVGYGVDLIGGINHSSAFNVQQAFVDIQLINARLSFGSKQRPMEMKDAELSSGGMTFSQNAVPIPQLRFELPDWWNISGKSRLVFIKGHIAYGMCSDGWWQRNHNDSHQYQLYSKRSLYHSKAGYMKVGNKDRFPLVFTGGLEMVCQFGGTVYNMADRPGTTPSADSPYTFGPGTENKLPAGMKDFFHAFIPGGSDSNDGDYNNVSGNQLGSWEAALEWHGKDWMLRAYMDHYFEDHSMMFWQYAWKDNLLGLEVHLPKNPVVSKALMEYIGTMDQAGPIYHDITEQFPTGLYGIDTYYNHHIYGGYQHWGQNLGNPLLLSPAYNTNGSLQPTDNRIRAYHAGLAGDPCGDVHWRMLYSHVRSLGTYDTPAPAPRKGHFFMAEAQYTPHQLCGWHFGLSYGFNLGDMLGRSHGAMLSISKSGVFNFRKVE